MGYLIIHGDKLFKTNVGVQKTCYISSQKIYRTMKFMEKGGRLF